MKGLNMKIPAIRAAVGIWVYYIAALTYSEVHEHVEPVDDELHKSTVLREILQRSITDNYEQIASYITQQDERFFNALVLAVYDGDPQWHEVRLDYGDGDEFYDIGILELTGNEKIFPVDGQHRVEGIRKVVDESSDYNNEKIPIILIGHKKDEEGMIRSRRLFSTLNRYAKPVSKRDIIALDEDDAAAIVTRELIESHSLFEEERILDSKTKAIPDSDKKAFTTIVTLYDCNYELLHHYLSDKEVSDPNRKDRKLVGKSKAKEYIRFRPERNELEEYLALCLDFWSAVVSEITDVTEYLNGAPDAIHFRNREGGNILFRPAALIPFTKAAARIRTETAKSFSEIMKGLNSLPLSIISPEWAKVLWDSANKRMLMGHRQAVELRLIHLYDAELLSAAETERLIKLFAKAHQVDPEAAKAYLSIE